MKKKFKILGLTLSACMAFGLAALASGCSAKDKTDKWFEQLFCEHKYDEGVETQAPTCTEEGVLTYTCTECGKTKKEDIPTIDHTEAEMPSVSPTCTEVGYTDGVKCAVCEEVLQQPKVVAKIPHFEVQNSEAVAATCTTAGLKPGTHCARCDEVITEETVIPATGHIDENIDGNCDNCSKAFYEAMDYVEAPIVNMQTNAYTTDGVWYRVYLPEETEGPVMYFIEFVDNIGSNANGDNLNCIGIPSKNSLANGSYERAIYVGSSGTKFVKVEGIEFYYAPNDEYVDFCLTMGDELTNEAENISFSLTNNTYVLKVWDSSSLITDEKYQWEVYLLVAPSEE